MKIQFKQKVVLDGYTNLELYIRLSLYCLRQLIFSLYSLDIYINFSFGEICNFTKENINYSACLSFCKFIIAAFFFLSRNKYGYYVCIAFSLRNCIYTFVLLTLNSKQSCPIYHCVSFYIINIYLIEIFLSIYLLSDKKIEHNLLVFQTVGASEVATKAISYRFKLKIACFFALFHRTVEFAFEALYPSAINEKLLSPLLAAFVTLVQHLFINPRLSKENTSWRNLATACTFVMSALCFYKNIRLYIISKDRSRHLRSALFLSGIDNFIINLALLYYLIMDMKYFGAGIEEIAEGCSNNLLLGNRRIKRNKAST